MTIRAYIGIGSNLNDPNKQVQRAINTLATLTNTNLVKISSFYLSKPMGIVDQPDFINAVVAVDTTLTARELLKNIQQIEIDQGRVRTVKNAPRIVDLDLLLYGRAIISEPDLIVPHPGIKQREFVLYPLTEIAPDLLLPTGESVIQLKLKCASKEIAKVAD